MVCRAKAVVGDKLRIFFICQVVDSKVKFPGYELVTDTRVEYRDGIQLTKFIGVVTLGIFRSGVIYFEVTGQIVVNSIITANLGNFRGDTGNVVAIEGAGLEFRLNIA